MTTHYKALGKNIFVKYHEKPFSTESGIVLPDKVRERMADGQTVKAHIISVGPKAPKELKEGMMVAVNKNFGTRLADDVAVYNPEDVYAIYNL